MKWFHENPFWGWFSIAGGGAFLLALGLLWWSKSGFDSAQQDYDSSAAALRQIEASNPYPNAANTRKMQLYLENYHGGIAKLKTELATQVVPVVPLAPNEFQTRLRQAINAVNDNARARKVKLPEHFNLGFDEFTSALPQPADAPRLGQELQQIRLLLDLLIDSHVDAIKMFRRLPSPAALPSPPPGMLARASVPPAPSPVQRNMVEFTVIAAPLAARKLINQIAADREQFFVLRTLHVKNESLKGPAREATAPVPAPPPPPAIGAKPAASATPALTFIVGNEHLDLSARVEMVTFAF